ncbi:MAG TPA: ABC transporter permease [Edaphobacter sp.]|jgi:ABC-2 type transport system permease protein|nr:ABC transporter permease [Edaphobacter sp.]
MLNIWLIAKREYLERIRAKSFLLMTILIPLLMGGLVYGAALANGRSGNMHIAVVTQDPQFGRDLKSELESSKQVDSNSDGESTRRGITKVDVISPPLPDTRATLDNQLRDRKLNGYIWVTPSTDPHTRPTFEWVSNSKADILTPSLLGSGIRTTLTREGLGNAGMPASEVDSLLKPVDLITKDKNAAFASVYAFFFLMYFVILFYGMNVARSIIEEKTSRIFEVLLATIRPEEMMAGKVIGVGAVGLTQIGIWIVAGLLVTKLGLLAAGVSFSITPVQVAFFVIFFVLGYILYSSVAAALGAMTSSEQELQQMNMFLMLPLIACSVVILRVVRDSDGFIAKAFSFFPFCTPLIMYVRIAVHQPPIWQIALSIVGLILTILAVLWFASRIYRVGILMYGKKPNLPEILRWLKYS